MYKVIKRDGSVAEFDIAKISGAIAKAFGALNKPCDPNDIDFIALKVTADFEDKIKDDLISVEAIQDSAEAISDPKLRAALERLASHARPAE